MKKLFIFIFALSTSSIAFAQKPDKSLAKVRYSFSHIQDTTKKEQPYTENMLLVIGKNASVYLSYDKLNRDGQMQQQLTDQLRNQQGGGTLNLGTPGGGAKPTTPTEYFYFSNENKFFIKERVVNSYIVEEDVPKITWTITKDTASFSGVKCKKATAHFKGRNWVAWFAPELPFSSGPWKLNGLPGLIIDAYDDKKEVQFKFAGIEKIEEGKGNNVEAAGTANPVGSALSSILGIGGSSALGSEIKLPADAIKTNRKELENLKEVFIKDPQGFIKTQSAASGLGGFTPTPLAAQKMAENIANRSKMNNPIELPEKNS